MLFSVYTMLPFPWLLHKVRYQARCISSIGMSLTIITIMTIPTMALVIKTVMMNVTLSPSTKTTTGKGKGTTTRITTNSTRKRCKKNHVYLSFSTATHDSIQTLQDHHMTTQICHSMTLITSPPRRTDTAYLPYHHTTTQHRTLRTRTEDCSL